jgi:probable O-glycosylation ligase (exosortase A-associated)
MAVMVTTKSPTVAKGGAGAAPVGQLAGTTVGVGALLLLFGYATVEFVRPQIYLGSIASVLRPGLVLTLLLTMYWLKNWGPRALFADRLLVYVFLFASFATAWIPFTTNNYWAFQVAKGLWLFVTAAIVPISLFIVSAQRRRQFIAFWIAIHVYLAGFVIVNDGRGPGGILQDENDMAFALGLALPYPFFLAQRREATVPQRALLYGAAVLMLAAIVATHSRGGFIGLGCMVLYAISLSKRKIRNLLLCVVVVFIGVMLVPDSYLERIGTITDTTDSSRNERLTAWRIGANIFLDNPILGVGTGNYGTHSGPYHMALPDFERGMPVLAGRAAHSLYFTLLPELGLVGAVLFGLLVAGAFKSLRRCERLLDAASDDDAQRDLLLARSIRASLICYLAAGAFISVLYYPQFWYTIGIIVALGRDVEAKHRQRAEAAAR